MSTRRNVRYSRLAADEDDYYDHHDPRFDYTPKTYDKIPWKSILLANFLLLLGCFLLLLGFFIFTGHMGGDLSQAYGLSGLGLLTFIPGASIASRYINLLRFFRLGLIFSSCTMHLVKTNTVLENS